MPSLGNGHVQKLRILTVLLDGQQWTMRDVADRIGADRRMVKQSMRDLHQFRLVDQYSQGAFIPRVYSISDKGINLLSTNRSYQYAAEPIS